MSPRSTSLVLIPVHEPQETAAEKAARLQDEADEAVRLHVAQTVEALEVAASLCAQVASGGVSYHSGIKDVLRRQASEIKANLDRVQVIVERT
jgi:hypothetical protein